MTDSTVVPFAKVADFGLSRQTKKHDAATDDASAIHEYYRSQQGVFPIRWTAPEAMQSLVFTPASDIWSFGMVLMELYQDGAEPYSEVKLPQVVAHVMAGNRPEQPDGCNVAMYELLHECWSMDPSERPNFDRVVEVLDFNWKKAGGVDDSNASTANIYSLPTPRAAPRSASAIAW